MPLRPADEVARTSALYDFVSRQPSKRRLAVARAKTTHGAARLRMIAHLIDGDMRAIRIGDRLRYAARWLCGGGSQDVVLLADPDTAGDRCGRCKERRSDLEERGGPSVVYRLRSVDGDLLYIGSTGGPVASRFYAHEDKPWWAEVDSFTTEHFPNVLAARAAEIRAIRAERPKYNLRDVAS